MSVPIITPIIYPAAAEFWKGGFPTRYDYAFNNRQLTDLPTEYKVSADVAQSVAERLSLPTPLSLISTFVNKTHAGKYYSTTRQKTPIPPKSFFKIPNLEIYVSCPELTFLQAARHLNFISLVCFGFDLCAQYYASDFEKFGQAKRTPLTTPEQIIKYAMGTNHMHGSAKAIKAAKYVLSSSNSPIETRLAIILELPVRLGGYGLAGIEMNGAVNLSKRARELMGVYEIRGDLVWRKSKLVLEYNSKAVHNNDLVFYNDVNRVMAFMDSGWTCVAVTLSNIKTFDAMENIAGVIRSQLRLPAKKKLLSTYESEREKVFKALFK